jgi:hypothetical protein
MKWKRFGLLAYGILFGLKQAVTLGTVKTYLKINSDYFSK